MLDWPVAYAQTLGASVCVALGWRAAMQFVDECVGNNQAPHSRGLVVLPLLSNVVALKFTVTAHNTKIKVSDSILYK